ncbi:MAG: hypothetical protein AB9866_10325 [Syntrophobacteraceae bacterium]
MLKKYSILTLTILLAAVGCMSEVKPVLKPVQLDIPGRIANQRKWIDQAIASRELSSDAAKPILADLDSIKEKHERLKAQGALTVKEVEILKRMLDENSAMIFREKQKTGKPNPVGERY